MRPRATVRRNEPLPATGAPRRRTRGAALSVTRRAPPGPSASDARAGPEPVWLVVAHYGIEVLARSPGGETSRLPVRRDSSILVGDRVRLERGYPVPLPREGVLRRRDRRGRVRSVAANLDTVGIVLAPLPETPPAFVDRAIVGARAVGISPFVIVNKCDQAQATELAARVERDWPGVLPRLVVSAHQPDSLDPLRAYLRERGWRGVFVGVSGVGKSSLMNTLVRDADLSVGEINPQSGLGRHVTTNATLHALPDGGELIDTPGFRDFGPVAVTADELATHFPGFESALSEGCRYRDCRHREEPDCAVLAAVDQGLIRAERHAAYCALQDELRQAERDARGY